QCFVGQIHNGDEDAAIVTAVIGMARSLKLRVVAEGVETFEELEFLHAHHCEEAQGYYFSRPVPAGQFAKLLEAGISPETRTALRTLNARPDIGESSRKPRGATLSRLLRLPSGACSRQTPASF